jgi:hypothetical protein
MSSVKDLYLSDELETAAKLIQLGFGEFQNLDRGNDFYYLSFRHDLLKLKQTILSSYFATHHIPVLQEDLDLLTNDKDLDRLIYLLSEFGKYARYHNLDIVTSNPTLLQKLIDPDTAEEVLESRKRQILIKLEQFARAFCRQFTIGRLGKKAKQFSGVLHPFILLKNTELGNRNYRKETTRYKEKERKVHTRTLFDELQRKTNKRYHHVMVKKEEFAGDWPFYHDEVIIECREKGNGNIRKVRHPIY